LSLSTANSAPNSKMDQSKAFLTDFLPLSDSRGRSQATVLSKDPEKALFSQHPAGQTTHRAVSQLHRQRLWAALLLKVTFPDLGADYYAHTPFRPGLWFWKDLFSAIQPNHKLNLPIPDTLAVFEKYHWANWSDRQLGVTSEFSLSAFYTSLDRYREDKSKPIAILRVPAMEGGTKAIPLSWLELGDKVLKAQLPPVCLVQRLLKSHGKRPAILRLFYVVQEKEGKGSRGYFLSNTKTGMKTANGQFVVVGDVYEGIEAFALTKSSLSPLESISFQLVSYLQSVFPVRLLDISLDFLKDRNDQIWLLGCQGFHIDPAVPLCRELPADHIDQLSSVHCKLCLLPYQMCEMRKSVPYRLLLVYKEHTMGTIREVMDLRHLRVISQGFLSHSVSVCDICYQLILQENDLLQTELRLAHLLNVPFHPDYPSAAHSHQHPNFLPAELPQWRVLFFFRDLDRNCAGKVVLAYHFLGANWKIAFTPRQSDLNIARIHYFFAALSPETLNYLHSLRLSITLTTLNGDLIASGDCSPLALFTSQLQPEAALTQSINVLLFHSEELWATLRLEAGLARDTARNIRDLPASIEHIGPVYVPEAAFFTCDSLPPAWLEAFASDSGEIAGKSDIMDSSTELEKCYSPVIDLKSLLRPASKPTPRRSASLSHFRLPVQPVAWTSLVTRRPKSKPAGRWSESTASTSRVLYHTDSVSKLKSPALLSVRPTASLPISRFSCTVTEPEEAVDLRSLVQRFMERRGK